MLTAAVDREVRFKAQDSVLQRQNVPKRNPGCDQSSTIASVKSDEVDVCLMHRFMNKVEIPKYMVSCNIVFRKDAQL